MPEPTIAERKPKKVEVKEGEEYYWCACGKAKEQPYCDGSHKGTGFTPKKFVAKESGSAFLCQCKHTKNPPYCDGTHAKLGKNPGAPASAGGATPEEPHVAAIHELAKNGLSETGHR